MEVLVKSDGRRDRSFRPYIDQEELKRNFVLYDPNGYNVGTGLYDRTQPSCQRWIDHFHETQMRTHQRPSFSVDRDGRTYRKIDTSTSFLAYR